MVEIFSLERDDVVRALVSLGKVDYQYALESLLPLVDRLAIQRSIQNPKFYERLQRDILRGCVMPPITLAFVSNDLEGIQSENAIQAFVADNIKEGFILDGIQRLSTLKRAFESVKREDFPLTRALYVNVIVCPSVDNLLYRMITLNNGQRPMSARHQVEILARNAFSFSDGDLLLTDEKSQIRRRPGVFKRADFELAYMAFLSASINVDSQKLIQEKLDELLASKILERDPSGGGFEFSNAIQIISRLCELPDNDKWFKVTNNLVGFCAGLRDGHQAVFKVSAQQFEDFTRRFEDAFKAFNVSKIKLGKARRSCVYALIRKFGETRELDVSRLTEILVDVLE